MTDSEKHEVWVALRAVSDAINEIEKQTNRQTLHGYCPYSKRKMGNAPF